MANGIPLSIAQLPPLSSALSNSIIPVTQNGTTGSMTLAVLLGGPYTTASSLVGTENVLLNQSGTLVSANLAQLISLSTAIGSIAGTESLVLTPSAGSIKKTTVGGLITGATASSAIAGTEVFGNVGAAYQKTTIAQAITQATAAGNPSAGDLIPTTQNGNYRALSITQLAASEILYTATGTANAQTITPSPALPSLQAGMFFCFVPVGINTGAATLTVGATTKNIFAYGAALLGNELNLAIAEVMYDGTQFQLLNPNDATGSFNLTLSTGFATSPSGTVNWRILKGKTVFFSTPSAITAVSNAATFSATGWPTALQPATTKRVPIIVEDNGAIATLPTTITISNGSGTISCGVNLAGTGGFQTSGTKGFVATVETSYTLD